MSIFKKLYDRPFIRFLVYVFGLESFIRRPSRDFTAYFEYRTGSYKPDYFLYFPRDPHSNVYLNELFRKLCSYHGYELTQFLEFHYQKFADKKEFLRFLHYEMAVRLKAKTPKTKFSDYWGTVETCLLWVNEQKVLLDAALPVQTDEMISAGVEPQMAEVMQSFAGKITLYNHHHLTKVIQVFLLLKELKAPGKKPLQLFENFSTTDMAAVLRQFEVLGDKKVNTIQKKIGEANSQLHPDEPKTEKLIKALTDFFY
ncbi:MAG TPA: hypothetical protein VK518_04035 [Puia sp.]|nr:hypothetical protein [Puia sp.]